MVNWYGREYPGAGSWKAGLVPPGATGGLQLSQVREKRWALFGSERPIDVDTVG